MKQDIGSNVCSGVHRLFVAHEGTIEGSTSIKIYAVVVCTVCSASYLIEHVMDRDASKITGGNA